MLKMSLTALMTVFAITAITVPANAQKCPSGTYYDSSKGKCVSKRGS